MQAAGILRLPRAWGCSLALLGGSWNRGDIPGVQAGAGSAPQKSLRQRAGCWPYHPEQQRQVAAGLLLQPDSFYQDPEVTKGTRCAGCTTSDRTQGDGQVPEMLRWGCPWRLRWAGAPPRVGAARLGSLLHPGDGGAGRRPGAVCIGGAVGFTLSVESSRGPVHGMGRGAGNFPWPCKAQGTCVSLGMCSELGGNGGLVLPQELPMLGREWEKGARKHQRGGAAPPEPPGLQGQQPARRQGSSQSSGGCPWAWGAAPGTPPAAAGGAGGQEGWRGGMEGRDEGGMRRGKARRRDAEREDGGLALRLGGGQHHRVAQRLPGRGDRDSPGQGGCSDGLLQPLAHAEGQPTPREVLEMGHHGQHPRASVSPTAASCMAMLGPGKTEQHRTTSARHPAALGLSPTASCGELVCPHCQGLGTGLRTDRPGVQEAMGAISSPLGRRVCWLLETAELVVAHR